MIFARKSPRDVAKKDIENYIVFLYDRNKSSATRHLVCAALKFYYEDVLKRRFGLKYPKKSSKLPIVLGKDEILRMINSIKNPKHKLMIQIMYSAGLRVSELINLKINDLEINKGYGFVRKGKGSKDRMFIIASSLKDDIKKFIG